jgi:hypothetical protein
MATVPRWRAVSISQEGVERCNDLGAFTDRSGNALYRTGSDVADRKHATHPRLQRPTCAVCLLAGQHEAFRVEGDSGPRKSIRVRVSADEKKQVAHQSVHLFARLTPPAD